MIIMTNSQKKVLLIAGAGTLGTKVSAELLNKDCKVDVICLEEQKSDHCNLTYYQQRATLEFLTEFLHDRYYDAIVNFLHYPVAEEYPSYHQLLSAKTKQLVFLSSYRVYADKQHPVTETAPQLADVIDNDREFLQKENYALPKSKCENYIRSSGTDNWTIVRPVISFSNLRFDIVCNTGRKVIEAAEQGKKLFVPEASRKLTAGLDWAGNSGKLIANLLFKKEALQEAFTVSSGQNLTWGEIADIYTDLLGVEFEWVSTEEYGNMIRKGWGNDWFFIYDRLFDRDIDCSKVLSVTGLKNEDFLPLREAIALELKSLNAIPKP